MLRLVRLLSTATTVALLATLPALPATAASVGRIENGGELQRITTNTDLTCQLNDSYGADGGVGLFAACGWVVVANGVAYRSGNIPGHAIPGVPFGPQPSTIAPQYGGYGTINPDELSTHASLATTEQMLNLSESYYEPKHNTVYSSLTVQNESEQDLTVTVYRIIDCRIQGSTSGSTWAKTEGTAFATAGCRGASQDYSLVMTSAPFDGSSGTPVARAGHADPIWAAAGAGQAFAGAPSATDSSTMAIAMQWTWTVPAGAADAFGTGVTLVKDLDHDGRADNGEPPALDSDGDGLPNAWEEHGLTIGDEHLDFPGWGASPDRKDVFLQVNWMSTQYAPCSWAEFLFGCTEKKTDFAPSRTALDKLVAAFATAPVGNPDGSTGITLHIDAGSKYPTSAGGQWEWPNGGMTLTHRKYFSETEAGRADALKNAILQHMRPARREVFHLLILGDAQAPGSSARSTGVALTPGDSLFVAAPLLKSELQLAATIMHELGHNLGLNHGGPTWFEGSVVNCKPAYRSVMNYMYQLSGQFLDYSRDDTNGNPAPSSADRKGCDSDYPTSAYDTVADWPHLLYSPRNIGGPNNGIGDEVINHEITIDDLEAAGLAGRDGDGGISLASPLVFVAGATGQTVPVTIENLGSASATYTAIITVGTVSATRTATVPGKSTAVLHIPVPTSQLGADQLSVHATLRPSADTTVLSEYSLDYTVLPHDPGAAQDALATADSTALTPEQQALVDSMRETLEDIAAGPSMVVERLSGPDRFATAVEVSKQFASHVPIVYVATGLNYPDALSAGAAAASQGGPVLLTTRDSLPAIVKAELARLKPQQIVIVGDEVVVSAEVAAQLSAYGPVRRDGGSDRYETSRIVVDRAFASATTVYVATGVNFPDALSATPAAVSDKAPVLLVPGTSDDLPVTAANLLKKLGATTVVVAGGTPAVTAGIQSAIDALPGVNVVRKAGDDRFGTSVELNKYAFSNADTVFLATGLNFPDALAGGALAGFTSSPLFAVLPHCIPGPTMDEIEHLDPVRILLLGGTPTLSPSVEDLTRC